MHMSDKITLKNVVFNFCTYMEKKSVHLNNSQVYVDVDNKDQPMLNIMIGLYALVQCTYGQI